MSEERLKYLEFLQSAISRMASNSFLVKGWSVALGTAVLGFSVKDSNWRLALIGVLPAASYWVLDAYYIALEKLFRVLWDKAVADTAGASFKMQPAPPGLVAWFMAAWTRSVWLVHGPVIAVSLLVARLLWATHRPP